MTQHAQLTKNWSGAYVGLGAPGDIQPGSRRRGETPDGESSAGLGVVGVRRRLAADERCFSRGTGVTGADSSFVGAVIVGMAGAVGGAW
jgi:hypothetical protein